MLFKCVTSYIKLVVILKSLKNLHTKVSWAITVLLFPEFWVSTFSYISINSYFQEKTPYPTSPVLTFPLL